MSEETTVNDMFNVDALMLKIRLAKKDVITARRMLRIMADLGDVKAASELATISKRRAPKRRRVPVEITDDETDDLPEDAPDVPTLPENGPVAGGGRKGRQRA